MLLDPSGRIESAGLDFSYSTGRLKQRTSAPPGPAEVPALSGACLLMPSSARFDTGFRHGMEDIEDHIVVERHLTPSDIDVMYNAEGGAI